MDYSNKLLDLDQSLLCSYLCIKGQHSLQYMILSIFMHRTDLVIDYVELYFEV